MSQIASPAAPSALTNVDFAVPDSLVEELVRQNARSSYAADDPAWREIAAKAIGGRRLGMRRWLRRLLTMGRNAREQDDVRTGYEAHWNLKPTVEQYVASLNDRVVYAEWRGRGMELAPQALRQIHMLYLMQAIDAVRPRHVLEVGCGNGNVVLSLAASFPEIGFTGVELTESGIAAARAVQDSAELPPAMVAASPRPLVDLTAHRRVTLMVGDARTLPFPDRAFDLVYTRLALEQMEQIREAALREIARLAARAVVLIEPWRDFNQEDPGRAYVRRMGYFAGHIADLRRLGFEVKLSTADLPQKVQFTSGPVAAIRI